MLSPRSSTPLDSGDSAPETRRIAESAISEADEPAVRGKPLVWLRLEGLSVLAAGIGLFATTGQPWWILPLGLMLPDLLMAGYVGGPRVGAALYNFGHAYPIPIAVSLIGAGEHHSLLLAFGLLWFSHIGMDRALAYGLKYDSGPTHTHLGSRRPAAGARQLAHRAETRAIPPVA